MDQPYGPTLWTVAARLLRPWDSLGKNTGVGCHFLLQGNFPIQGSNSCLLMSSALWGGFFTTRANWKAAKRRSRWETPRFRIKKLSCILSNKLFFFFFFCQLCYLGQNFSHLQGRFLFCKLKVRGRSSISPLCNYLV